jgi:hypothetical protein
MVGLSSHQSRTSSNSKFHPNDWRTNTYPWLIRKHHSRCCFNSHLDHLFTFCRNIGLPTIHTRINRVFWKNLLVEEDLIGIRDKGLKRKPKKDQYLHVVLVIYVLNMLVVPLTVLLIPVCNSCSIEPSISSNLLVIVPSILVACSKPFF